MGGMLGTGMRIPPVRAGVRNPYLAGLLQSPTFDNRISALTGPVGAGQPAQPLNVGAMPSSVPNIMPVGLGMPSTSAPQAQAQAPAKTGGFLGNLSDDMAFALASSLLQGPSFLPVSTAKKLTSGLLAGRQLERDAETNALTKQLTEAKIAELNRKGTGLFSGTSAQSQSLNIIRELGPLVESGKATDQQIQDYKLAESVVSKPTPRQVTNPDGSVTTVLSPGINVADLGLPSFVKAKDLGTKKPDYSQAELDSSKFASKAYQAESTLRELEVSGGYDPTNSQDYYAQLTPAGVRGFFTSGEGQRYSRAKEAFITATLRDESGAAIGTEEYLRKERELFPLPGDKPKTIEDKRLARQRAFEDLMATSGGHYEQTYPDRVRFELIGAGTKESPYYFSSLEEVENLGLGQYGYYNGQLYTNIPDENSK